MHIFEAEVRYISFVVITKSTSQEWRVEFDNSSRDLEDVQTVIGYLS